MNIGFHRISPTPLYPFGITLATLSGLPWSSEAGAVIQFKNGLKKDLRKLQLGRCCYCRRLLGDPISTHLEHFLEKAEYASFTFEICNISLSCGICNGAKTRCYLRVSAHLTKRLSLKMGVKTKARQCPALVGKLAAGAPLPTASADYRWVHPHFDDYGNHIAIARSWMFRGVTRKGARMIRSLQLNALASLEKSAMGERLAMQDGALSVLLVAIGELKTHQAKDICRVVAAEVRRRILG
jgi:hypothetical protein